MRIVTQIAAIGVLAAVGVGGWYGYKTYYAPASPQAGAGNQRAAPPVPVEVVPARSGTVTERIEAIGTARALESVTITGRNTGNISVINFTEGEFVRAGTVLIELESRERRADLDQARAARDESRQRYERSLSLRATGAVPQARIDEQEAQFRASEARLRAVESRYDDVRLTAPFDGRVGMRQVSMGALIQPGTVITTLDDVSRIRVDFSLPEIVLGRARQGLRVTARSIAFSERSFQGEISAVDTRVDPATRSVRVTAIFPNTDETLRPGMFLNIDVGLIERSDAVLVPEEAVISEATRQFVYVVRPNNTADRREVQIGQRQQGEIEIVRGIEPGDRVVVRGIQRLRANAPVTPRAFQPPAPAAPPAQPRPPAAEQPRPPRQG